jgi:hypothetical protein
LDSLKRAFESVGIEFIDENGGGSGVRLRKRSRAKQPSKRALVLQDTPLVLICTQSITTAH